MLLVSHFFLHMQASERTGDIEEKYADNIKEHYNDNGKYKLSIYVMISAPKNLKDIFKLQTMI